MSYVPRHSTAIPARMKAARAAMTGLATAVVGTGVAVATTGSAHAAGGSVWDRVAQCESGGNWSINTGNGFSGGLQFTPSTWRAYGGQGSAQNASRAEQIRVAQRVLAGQGPGAWPVCSKRAGLTRANGGAASSVTVSRSAERTAVATKKRTHRSETAVRATTSTRHVSAKHTGPRSAVAHGLRAEIRTIQRELGVTADGIIGPVTSRAIQKYVGVTQDGIIGPVTVAAVEKKLNLTQTGARHLKPSRIEALANHLAD